MCTCSRDTWNTNKSNKSSSEDVVSTLNTRKSACWLGNSEISPKPVMSRNKSLIPSASSGRSKGPMRTSSSRCPEGAVGAGAATVDATGAGAATTVGASKTGAGAIEASAWAGATVATAAAGAPPPAASSLMRRTKSTVEGGSLVSPVWWRASKTLDISADSSSTSTMAELGSSS